MLKSEISFHQGHWWFSVVETGRLGQALETVFSQRCQGQKDAHELDRAFKAKLLERKEARVAS